MTYGVILYVRPQKYVSVATPTSDRMLPESTFKSLGLDPGAYYVASEPIPGYEHIAELYKLSCGSVMYKLSRGYVTLCRSGVEDIFHYVPKNLYVRNVLQNIPEVLS